MSEVFKVIVGMFAGTGVIAWIVTLWALRLAIQKRLSIYIAPKAKGGR